MKSSLVIISILLMLATTGSAADRVEKSRSWTESFVVTTSTPVLEIRNIWGDVRVRAGKEGEISVTINERRSAPNQDLYERSLEILKLDIQASDNGVSMYVGERDRHWHRKDPCRRCRVDYQFDVQVPVNADIDVSTVNDGRVEVTGVSGLVSADNINGPISISAMRNCDEVSNVNGAVNLGFASAPGRDCRIETINGDITIEVPDGSGLNVAMDLFNGYVLPLPEWPGDRPAVRKPYAR